jgi:hypothetical protein
VSSNKHTPGPWLFRSKSSSIHSAPPADTSYQYGEALARFAEDDNVCADVGDADLALILAAPDLLEACEEAADDVCHAVCPPTWRTKAGQPHNGICSKVRAAIKKARGE